MYTILSVDVFRSQSNWCNGSLYAGVHTRGVGSVPNVIKGVIGFLAS